jgi:hypothetical protein
MRVQITLKNGVQIEADVDEFSTFRNQLTNEITKLNWSTPEGWKRKLHTINLEEIVAIVLFDPNI